MDNSTFGDRDRYAAQGDGMIRQSFMLWDPETEVRASMQSWPNESSARLQRELWIARCLRGGRPDISLEFLDRLIVLPSAHVEPTQPADEVLAEHEESK